MAVNIFCSYAHEDGDYMERLRKHLGGLTNSNKIKLWNDRLLRAGDEWSRQIVEELEKAHIIIMLLSADFIASEYCMDIEVKKAFKLFENGSVKIIPVLCHPIVLESTPFASLQIVPDVERPIDSWENRDVAFALVANSIRGVVQGIDGKASNELSEESVIKKIMIVEDDSVWRERVRRLLTELGHHVYSYSEYSEELLIKLINDKYDLLIVDLLIENENIGPKLMAFVRKHDEKVPIIVLSGTAELDVAIEAFFSYKVHHLIQKKDWDVAEFLSTVDAALNGKRK